MNNYIIFYLSNDKLFYVIFLSSLYFVCFSYYITPHLSVCFLAWPFNLLLLSLTKGRNPLTKGRKKESRDQPESDSKFSTSQLLHFTSDFAETLVFFSSPIFRKPKWDFYEVLSRKITSDFAETLLFFIFQILKWVLLKIIYSIHLKHEKFFTFLNTEKV
jgi:hypothetical protein